MQILLDEGCDEAAARGIDVDRNVEAEIALDFIQFECQLRDFGS